MPYAAVNNTIPGVVFDLWFRAASASPSCMSPWVSTAAALMCQVSSGRWNSGPKPSLATVPPTPVALAVASPSTADFAFLTTGSQRCGSSFWSCPSVPVSSPSCASLAKSAFKEATLCSTDPSYLTVTSVDGASIQFLTRTQCDYAHSNSNITCATGATVPAGIRDLWFRAMQPTCSPHALETVADVICSALLGSVLQPSAASTVVPVSPPPATVPDPFVVRLSYDTLSSQRCGSSWWTCNATITPTPPCVAAYTALVQNSVLASNGPQFFTASSSGTSLDFTLLEQCDYVTSTSNLTLQTSTPGTVVNLPRTVPNLYFRAVQPACSPEWVEAVASNLCSHVTGRVIGVGEPAPSSVVPVSPAPPSPPSSVRVRVSYLQTGSQRYPDGWEAPPCEVNVTRGSCLELWALANNVSLDCSAQPNQLLSVSSSATSLNIAYQTLCEVAHASSNLTCATTVSTAQSIPEGVLDLLYRSAATGTCNEGWLRTSVPVMCDALMGRVVEPSPPKPPALKLPPPPPSSPPSASNQLDNILVRMSYDTTSSQRCGASWFPLPNATVATPPCLDLWAMLGTQSVMCSNDPAYLTVSASASSLDFAYKQQCDYVAGTSNVTCAFVGGGGAAVTVPQTLLNVLFRAAADPYSGGWLTGVAASFCAHITGRVVGVDAVHGGNEVVMRHTPGPASLPSLPAAASPLQVHVGYDQTGSQRCGDGWANVTLPVTSGACVDLHALAMNTTFDCSAHPQYLSASSSTTGLWLSFQQLCEHVNHASNMTCSTTHAGVRRVVPVGVADLMWWSVVRESSRSATWTEASVTAICDVLLDRVVSLDAVGAGAGVSSPPNARVMASEPESSVTLAVSVNAAGTQRCGDNWGTCHISTSDPACVRLQSHAASRAYLCSQDSTYLSVVSNSDATLTLAYENNCDQFSSNPNVTCALGTVHDWMLNNLTHAVTNTGCDTGLLGAVAPHICGAVVG